MNSWITVADWASLDKMIRYFIDSIADLIYAQMNNRYYYHYYLWSKQLDKLTNVIHNVEVAHFVIIRGSNESCMISEIEHCASSGQYIALFYLQGLLQLREKGRIPWCITHLSTNLENMGIIHLYLCYLDISYDEKDTREKKLTG